MDDHNASDMRCGDLTGAELKSHYWLDYISEQVDPWTLIRRSSRARPQSMFCCNLRGPREKITRLQCVSLLFDEFHSLSGKFLLYGAYSHLIKKMITHMQKGNGKLFRDMALDLALKEQIIRDNSIVNSTRLLLEEVFNTHIDWDNKYYPLLECWNKKVIRCNFIWKSTKFNRFKDNFNGMRITVHNTWATRSRLPRRTDKPCVSVPTVFTPLLTSRSRKIAHIAKVSTRLKASKLGIRRRRTLNMKVIAQKHDCGESIGD